MLQTDKGFSFEAELTQTAILASRGKYPDKTQHSVLILKFLEGAKTIELVKDTAFVKQVIDGEYETITTIYQLDGFYQEITENGFTHLWFWLDRVDYDTRANADKIKELDMLLKAMTGGTTE